MRVAPVWYAGGAEAGPDAKKMFFVTNTFVKKAGVWCNRGVASCSDATTF